MISLYESILKSVGAGKKVMIDKWCQENMPFEGHYEITKDLEIKSTQIGQPLTISYEEYNELPDYIQFADDPTLVVKLGAGSYRSIRVAPKSLRGLPKKCKSLEILLNAVELPDLEITVDHLFVQTNVVKLNKFNVNFEGEVCRFKIRSFKIKSFDELTIKGVKTIDMVNDFNWGDEFSKQIARKADMNKYKGHYETPVTDRGLEVINSFFGKHIDISDLQEIDYTQNSRLVKRNGKWYRCKNW